MRHLDEGTTHAWLDGALPGDESAWVERHAERCAQCAELIAEARGLVVGASIIVSSLDIVASGVIPRQPAAGGTGRSLWRSLRLTPFRAALAASLMVGVASMFAVRGGGPNAPAAEQRRVEPARTAVAPVAPPVVVPARPASPAERPPATGQQREMAPNARTAIDPGRRVVEAPVVVVTAADAAPPSSVAKASGAGMRRGAESIIMRHAAGAGIGKLDVSQYEGCYRVEADSANWPRPLPARFALARTRSEEDRRRNIILTLDAGRPDTVVAGTWRVVSDTLVNVTWTGVPGAPGGAVGLAGASFSIRYGTSVPTALAATGAGARPVRIAYTGCAVP